MGDVRAQIYFPLDVAKLEIRVVEIISNEPERPVECRLLTVSLKDNPDFMALSYLWGDPLDTVDIRLNGHVFPVTRNLESALRHIQTLNHSFGRPRQLWADAVCINQQDVPERSSQVQNVMRLVYKNATEVICWLGPRDEIVIQGFRILKAFSQASQATGTGHQRLIPRLLHMYGRICRKVGHVPKTYDIIHAWSSTWMKRCKNILEHTATYSILQHFVRLAYWQRVWVFQELVLAKEVRVFSGLEHTDFLDMCLAFMELDLIRIDYETIRPPYINQDTWYWIKNGLTPPNSALMQIYHYRVFVSSKDPDPTGLGNKAWKIQLNANEFKATDPRDFVYGLQGLTKGNIPVDYSLPVLVVYCNMIQAFLNDTGGSLSFLETAGSGYGDLPTGWPSWVSGYYFRATDLHIAKVSVTNVLTMDTDLPSNGQHATISNNAILKVNGSFVEAVSYVHPRFNLLPLHPINLSKDGSIALDWFDIANQNRPFLVFLRTFVSENRLSFMVPPLEALLRLLFREGIGIKLAMPSCTDWLDLLVLCLAAEAGNPLQENWRLDWSLLGVHKSTKPAIIAGQIFDKSGFERAAWSLVKTTISRLLTDPHVCIVEAVARCRRKGCISLSLTTQQTHRIIQTESKSYGLAPPHSRAGDMLCYLQGCRQLALLRPKDSAAGRFEFLGLCWVIGSELPKRYHGDTSDHELSIRSFELI